MEPSPLAFADWWHTHALLVSMIPAGSRVLDVGCGFGRIARRLREKDCSILGLEPDPERAQVAAQWCDAVIERRAEELAELGLQSGSFDVVLFADVLEHLVDPWEVLRVAAGFLKPDGRVVISMPNAANYAVRLNLLKGEFRYQTEGLWDRTHLRWFTKATFRELVESAGLEVEHWRYTPNLTCTNAFRKTLGRVRVVERPFRLLDRWLTYRFSSLLTYQFVVACRRRKE